MSRKFDPLTDLGVFGLAFTTARALRRVPWDVLGILALPFALTFLNETWIFSKPVFIDRWIYSGFHLHLPEFLRRFSDTYYAARVPWNELGWLVHRYFDAATSLYILHFIVFYVATFSIYIAVLNLFGDRLSAFCTAVLAGTYPYLLFALGWDYVEGPSIACIFWSLAAMTAVANSERWRLASILWAAAIILTSSLYILLIAFAPMEICAFLLLNRLTTRRPLLSVGSYFTVGAAAATLFLCFVNSATGGPFLYMASQIAALGPVAKFRFHYYVPLNDWLWTALWLILPTATMLFSLFVAARSFGRTIVRLRSRASEVDHFASLIVASTMCVGSFAIFAILQSYHFYVLQEDYNANALLPFAFLAIGASLSLALKGASDRVRRALAVMFLVATIGPWFLAAFRIVTSDATPYQGHLNPILWTVAGALFLIANLFTRRAGFVASVCFLSFFSFSNANNTAMAFPVDPSYKQGTLAVFEASAAVAPFNPEANAKFWFNANDQFGNLERDVISSYLYGYSLINESFPQLPGNVAAFFIPGQRVIILASGGDPVSTANGVLAINNVRLRFIARRDVVRPGVHFEFVVTEVERR